jgi:hypothetical protein
MQINTFRYAACGALLAGLAACGGGSTGMMEPSPQSGTVPLIISDASAQDWAAIDVRVLSIALIPQDVLTVAADPEAGFSLPAGTAVASSDIEIQHTQGSSPTRVVPIPVSFVSPLVVTTNQNDALDLEFNLSHPAFIVGHMPPGAASTHWAVNFTGPVRHRPIADITRLVLRHMYGTVTALASDNSSVTITRDFAALPVQAPETSAAGSQSLTLLADAANGTSVCPC